MRLPAPTDQLAGCIWLPRILMKARLLSRDALSAEYVERFCHPTGVDGQFIAFFGLTKEEVLEAARFHNSQVVKWFIALPGVTQERIAEWNHLAVNFGREGFPMAERLPVVLATTYQHLQDRNLQTVFEVLEADEEV
ncbi:MAG: DUF5069 domain-containing protein [Luteolibacter sp.]